MRYDGSRRASALQVRRLTVGFQSWCFDYSTPRLISCSQHKRNSGPLEKRSCWDYVRQIIIYQVAKSHTFVQQKIHVTDFAFINTKTANIDTSIPQNGKLLWKFANLLHSIVFFFPSGDLLSARFSPHVGYFSVRLYSLLAGLYHMRS